MSLLFPIFPHVPDFRESTTRTVSTAHDRINLAAGRGEVLFAQRTPDVIFNHSFTFETRLESSQVKEFFRDKGGRTWAFFIPSWKRDIRLVGPVSTGTKQIPIISPNEDYAAKHLDETDPDHHGRFLYFYRDGAAVFGTDIIRVLPGASSGQEILDLDNPLPFSIDDKTFVGWLYLCRFGDDQLAWTHYSPDHSMVEIAFRATRRAVQNSVTRAVERIDQYGQIGFESAEIAPSEILPVTNRVAYATGPVNLAVVQEELYDTRWAVWPAADGVRIKRVLETETIWLPDTTGQKSILFTGPITTDHIALAFDQNSYEVIGYQKTAATIEIRRFFNSAVDIRTFTGLDPLLQFNGLLNDDLETGETDVVCYYIKPDDNALYMRFQRDNFGTEYLAAQLPARPLSLKRAYYVRNEADTEGTLTVEYVEAGLRVAKLISAVYAPPPEPPPPPEVPEYPIDTAAVALTHTMAYSVGITYWDGQEYYSLHIPEKDEAGVTIEHSASYTNALRYYDGGTLGDPHTPLFDSASVAISESSEYTLLAIPADNQTDSATVELSTTAEYALGAVIPPKISEFASVELTTSAAYEPA